MTDSNQALSWNVFFRDRLRFEQAFPSLRLEESDFLPWLSYLLSGGVTRRNLLPAFLTRWVGACDAVLRPLDPWMSLHWHLRVRKAGGERPHSASTT